MNRLVDWHVHCFLPEHRSAQDVALQQRRKVAGDGRAEPERLRAAVGEAGRVWAARHLVKGREVTTSGPYRFTGHPLYLGSLIIGAGCVVAASSMVVAAVVLAYLAVMLPVAMRLEEATLADAFADSYARYRRGAAPRSGRRFSVERARRNREHLAVAGILAAVALGGLRVWWVNGWP